MQLGAAAMFFQTPVACLTKWSKWWLVRELSPTIHGVFMTYLLFCTCCNLQRLMSGVWTNLGTLIWDDLRKSHDLSVGTCWNVESRCPALGSGHTAPEPCQERRQSYLRLAGEWDAEKTLMPQRRAYHPLYYCIACCSTFCSFFCKILVLLAFEESFWIFIEMLVPQIATLLDDFPFLHLFLGSNPKFRCWTPPLFTGCHKRSQSEAKAKPKSLLQLWSC